MLIQQWSGQRSLSYMVSEQTKNNDVKLNFYVKLVDTLLMNSGYDEATQQQHPLYFPYSLITDTYIYILLKVRGSDNPK